MSDYSNNMNLQDLEQFIMQVWSNTETALDNALWRIMDSAEGMPSEDDIANILIGIQTNHDIACQRLFAAYEQVLKNFYSARKQLDG